MCMMTTSRRWPEIKKRKPAPRTQRKIRDIDLTEEIRDLEHDISLHSTPEASKTHSCMKDSRILTHDKQPETQRCNKAERGNTTASCAGGRRMISTTTSKVSKDM